MTKPDARPPGEQGSDLSNLRSLLPEPWAEIHPQTAALHGIGDGNWVEAESARGKVKLSAKTPRRSHIRDYGQPVHFGSYCRCRLR